MSASPLTDRILLVEDDGRVRRTLKRGLEKAGFEVVEAETIEAGLEVARRVAPDLAVVDYQLPDGSAFDFLERTREEGLPAVVLTGQGTIPLAVEAIQLGAEHFLTKPVDMASLVAVMGRVLERRRRERRYEADRASLPKERPSPFVGPSEHVADLRSLAQTIVTADAPILILGETGTGKGVLARWLHDNGPRRDGPFMDLNCSGLSRELVESELFGHQRGAFTGASATKRGLLEVAHRGTLFLDEIGDLDPAVQPKLLKALEEKAFRRLGEVENRSVDVRLIAATHRDLEAMSETGAFRRDLLFRINTVTITLPALRERTEDIPELAERILGAACREAGRPIPPLSDRAREALQRHPFLGNLRELRNVIERALLFHDHHGPIEPRHLSLPERRSMAAPTEVTTLEVAERNMILLALERSDGKVDEAARLLDVPRSSLYAKIKRHGISRSG